MTSWIFAPMTCRCKGDEAMEDTQATLDMGQKQRVAANLIRPNSLHQRRDLSHGATNTTSDETLLPALPQYEVVERLGEGGMGIVYAVKDRLRGDIYAIKILKDEIVQDNASVMRFEQEANATVELMHPNIGHVFGAAFDENGSPYLLMEYIEGTPLSRLLKRKDRLPESVVIEIFTQVALALQHAHGKGVVHRDLKPSNILITNVNSRSPGVKLVDFGIAKLLERRDSISELTQKGEIFGSPYYMSPEQCMGEEIDERSDIYSMGCALYESLSGEHLFSGNNPIQILMCHLNASTKVPLKKLREKGVSANVIAVLKRMLEKAPKARYQNMHDLIEDLHRVGKGRAPKTFVDKHAKLLVGGGAATMIVAAVSVGVSLWIGNLAHHPSLKTQESVISTEITPFAEVDSVTTKFQKADSIVIPGVDDVAISLIQGHKDGTPLSISTGCSDKVLKYFDQVKSLKELRLYNTDLTGDNFGHLSHLSLEVLILKGSYNFGSEGMAIIKKMDRLRTLDLQHTAITDQDVIGLPLSLSQLSIAQTNITAKGLAAIAALPNLTALNLNGCHALSGKDLLLLAKAHKLQQLSIDGITIADADLHKVLDGNFPDLTAIELRGDRLSAAAFRGIKLPKLQRFAASGSNIARDALGALADSAPAIQEMNFSTCRNFDNASLEAISKFTSLIRLDLSNTEVNDRGIQPLAQTHLKYLNLSHLVHLTDRAIPQLGEISTLRQINFFATFNVTSSSRAKLQALLPNCAVTAVDSGQPVFSLDTSFSGIDDKNYKDRIHAGNSASRIGDISLSSSMVPDMDEVAVHTILVNKNEPTIRLRSGCTDKVLETFDQLRKTNNLSFPQAEFTGTGFVHLVHLPIQMLDLQQSERFGHEGMQYVNRMRELQSLSLEKTNITDGDLANLPTNITELSLSGTKITSAGLHSLKRLRKLKTLILNNCSGLVGKDFTPTIVDISSLENLSLVGAPISNTEIRDLLKGTAAHLRAIAIDGNLLTAQSFNDLSLPRLEKVSLKGTKLAEGVLTSLAGAAPNMRELDLSSCKFITDDHMKEIPKFTKLRDLNVYKTWISENSVPYFLKTKLSTLNLGHLDRFTNKSLEELASLKSLQTLKLIAARSTDRAGFARFRELNPTCKLDSNVVSPPLINFREQKLFTAPIQRASEI